MISTHALRTDIKSYLVGTLYSIRFSIFPVVSLSVNENNPKITTKKKPVISSIRSFSKWTIFVLLRDQNRNYIHKL